MSYSNGYKYEYMPNHHRAFSNGTVYEHVLVAEEKLNRKLMEGEAVHHIDGNRLNNNPENLLVFATVSDHSCFHSGCSYFVNEDGSAVANRIERLCRICGNQLPKMSKSKVTICKKCSSFLSRKVEWPDRNKLKELIRNNSFVSVGKMFSVNDNSVRKWCKYYGLPHRVKDVKMISDEDWINM